MVKVELYINDSFSSAGAIFADDLKVACERESEEMYRRIKVSDTFTFVREDFFLLYNANIDDAFEIRIKDDDHLIARCKFEKTDCEFDVDNGICRVKVSSTDNYDKILSTISNEYDLVKLAPARKSIGLQKRAILQIYMFGDDKISNVIGNMSYEVDLNPEIVVSDLTDHDLTHDYNFVVVSTKENTLKVTGSGILNLDGDYYGTFDSAKTRFVRRDGLYKIEILKEMYGYSMVFKDSLGQMITVQEWNPAYGRYESMPVQTSPSDYYPTTAHPFGWRQWDESVQGWRWVQKFSSAVDSHNIYARVLIDTPTPSPTTGVVKKLATSDICANNLNYRYCMQALGLGDLSDRIVISSEVQSEPTPWGINGNEEYFVRPRPKSEGDNVLPIGWNRWIPMSFWFNSSRSLSQTMDQWNVEWQLNDAYPLWSVLKVLLAKADPSLTFDNDSSYSQFLFGNVSSAIYGHQRMDYYITPSTNVKRTYYSQAARKAKISLKSVLDMLRNTFQLYWFIDEEKRFRIEHITWFKNGGTYVQGDALVDLTKIYAPLSNKEWGYGQNTISYDKNDLYKRYEFSWDSECSEVFEGFAIDIKNKFVGNGKTNKADNNGFISDVDMIISSPDRVSDDALVFLCADPSTDKCPISLVYNLGMDFISPAYEVQNGYLSLFNLELIYWLYNLGGDRASTSQYETIRGEDGKITVRDTQRVKKQKVTFPMDKDLFAKEGLIHTIMGDGEWVKETYHLESGVVDMELLMPTKDVELFVIDPQGVNTDGKERIVSIKVDSYDDNWVIKGTSPWCTIERLSSTEAILHIEQNLSTEPRTARFVFAVGTLEKNFDVNQTGSHYYFTHSPASLNFKSSGGTKTLTISTTGSWELTNIPEWIVVDKTSGVGDAVVEFTASENPGGPREDYFDLSSPFSTFPILATQAPSGEYVVDVDRERCINCGNCYDFYSCPVEVFKIGADGIPYIQEGCVACAECISEIDCPANVFFWRKG